MKSLNTEPKRKLRGKTDKSLKNERSRVDSRLRLKRKAVEKVTTASIINVREEADLARDKKRVRVDSEKVKVRRAKGKPSAIMAKEDESLKHEREISDEAQREERVKVDLLRHRERFQKRLISEALLETERKETDANLEEERSSIDSDSVEITLSHDRAKTDLVTRDQFLAVVSHDLKSPLSSISLSAGLLRQLVGTGKAEPSTLHRHVNTIERNVAHMDRMINDLLDVERMGNGKLTLRKQRIDFGSLLKESQTLFTPVVEEKSFVMTVTTCPKPAFASIDKDRILQVLSNLIGNALKFTPKGGTIKLSVTKGPKFLEVSVRDNGPGIPEDKIGEIFERFSQLQSNDRRGLGLGLFISKWIVEAHNGTIEVISTLGKGTTFSFTLPSCD